MNAIARKFRQRRETRAFERALREAPATIQEELFHAARRYDSEFRSS